MAEILVLAEHAGETVKKVTGEMLTAARAYGEPAAVWVGPGAEGGRSRLAEFGAVKVYVAASSEFDDYVVAPRAELLASLIEQHAPAAVLVAGSPEGRETAGRLAIKTGSGILTDVTALGDGLHACAHITGGGIVGNLPRVLPEGLGAVLDRSTWAEPRIFVEIQRLGAVAEGEMRCFSE